MSHNYNTRKKKESVVSSECLQTLKLISLIILSLKDEIISLKDTVIKRLQEENEGLCNKCQILEHMVALIKPSHDALKQYSRRNIYWFQAFQIVDQSSQILLMLKKGKWMTTTELANLILALKRPLLAWSIGSTA